MYSSTLSLSSVLDGGGSSTPRPSCFTRRRKTQYTLNRRLSGPQGWSGWGHKISPDWNLIPGLSSPKRVALPTKLSRPTKYTASHKNHHHLLQEKFERQYLASCHKCEIFKLYKDKHETFLRVVDMLIYITLCLLLMVFVVLRISS